MILRNFWGFIGGFLAQPLSYGQNKTITGCKNLSGANMVCYTCAQNTSQIGPFIQNTVSWSKTAVIVGTGDTAVTALDYCLDNDVTSQLSNYSSVLSPSYGDTNDLFTYTVSGENATGSDITIKEVGITKQYNSAVTTYSEFLVAREVLDTPIVIHDGEAFSFTYVWKQQ